MTGVFLFNKGHFLAETALSRYALAMFSGIVEALVPALSSEPLSGGVRLRLQRPESFNDIKGGDSIAVDGVCLTVESFDATSMVFVLGAETLQVLGWSSERALQVGRRFNLERSLRFGDRVHGHFVTGHVDSLGTVVRSEAEGESWFLDVRLRDELIPFVWHKGSLAVNGVSLTVNKLADGVASFCLIPETQERTNLADLKNGQQVNLEPDWLARAVRRALETGVNPAASPLPEKPA